MSVETVFIEVNLKTLKRKFFCKNYEHLLVRADFNTNIFEPKTSALFLSLKISSKNHLTRIHTILALSIYF